MLGKYKRPAVKLAWREDVRRADIAAPRRLKRALAEHLARVSQ